MIGMSIAVVLLCGSLALIFSDVRLHWIGRDSPWRPVPGIAILLGTVLSLWSSGHLARKKGYSAAMAYGSFGAGLLATPLFGLTRPLGAGGVAFAVVGVVPLLPIVVTLVLPRKGHGL